MWEFFLGNKLICVVAVIFALFYGLRAVPIWMKPIVGGDEDHDGNIKLERYENLKTWQRWDWWIHQFWLNASGQIAGWLFVYLLWKKGNNAGIEGFRLQDYAGVVIAFLGITGYLPSVLTKWQPKT